MDFVEQVHFGASNINTFEPNISQIKLLSLILRNSDYMYYISCDRIQVHVVLLRVKSQITMKRYGTREFVT